VGGCASLVLPGVAADGSQVVLKVQVPHRESEHEAAALQLWDGDGAVRLLAEDPDRGALLLECCRPGTPLWELGQDEALDMLAGLLPRLWKPAGAPFRQLVEEAAWWSETMPENWEHAGRPFEHSLLQAALDALAELAPSQGEQVLVHQDLHAGNVLRAAREPWLAIDPKPLSGEREFGVAASVRGGELGFSERDVRRRLDRLIGELGLDRERARGWAMAQTLAWAFEDDGVLPDHVECARWLIEAR
jgi:streptomycin 6-kinase